MQPRKRKWKKLIIILLLILPINSFNKKYNSFQFSEKNNKVDKLINVAQEIKTSSNTKGTTYYVSSDGKSYSGTDINNPMSLNIAIRKRI